jgi:hypothetical protein
VERISEGKPVSVKLAGIIIDIVTHMAPAKQWLGHCNNERPHKANGGFLHYASSSLILLLDPLKKGDNTITILKRATTLEITTIPATILT